MFFFEIFKISENDSGRGSCPSSYPSGNQVDGLPLVAICFQKDNVKLWFDADTNFR